MKWYKEKISAKKKEERGGGKELPPLSQQVFIFIFVGTSIAS